MTNEMIERVAKAIDRYGVMSRYCHIKDCPDCEGNKNELRENAKAAIEAMREPTEAMLNIDSYLGYEMAWKHMIDAALKDG